MKTIYKILLYQNKKLKLKSNKKQQYIFKILLLITVQNKICHSELLYMKLFSWSKNYAIQHKKKLCGFWIIKIHRIMNIIFVVKYYVYFLEKKLKKSFESILKNLRQNLLFLNIISYIILIYKILVKFTFHNSSQKTVSISVRNRTPMKYLYYTKLL